jgi:hypothetical protein
VETFVVRIFVPAGDERLELSGLIERTGSGRAEPFNGAQGLIDAVLRELDREDVEHESRPKGER